MPTFNFPYTMLYQLIKTCDPHVIVTVSHSYLVSFLLDSTVGLLLIFFLLKVVAKVVHRFDIKALRSGEYGMWLWQVWHVSVVYGIVVECDL